MYTCIEVASACDGGALQEKVEAVLYASLISLIASDCTAYEKIKAIMT